MTNAQPDKKLEFDASRYRKLKETRRVAPSDRYLLYGYSGMALSSEEFDRALDELPEPGEMKSNA